MLKYFDMMYYYYATFYKRYYKKTSGWQMQTIFIITVTQMGLLFDLYLVYKLYIENGKINDNEKIIFPIICLIILFYNMKRYEKKYQYYKSIWEKYEGNQRRLYMFLTVFTTVFVWGGLLILGFVSMKNYQ